MRKNLVKEKLRRGDPSIGTWVSTGSPLVAEILAHSGLDWLTIDMEHNAIDMESLLACFYAIGTTDTMPFVRVPWNDPQVLKRVLDVGAYGVVVPNIKTPEEAELAVQACRYAPEGFRGVGGVRGRLYGGPDYFEKANEEICVVLMIEDTEAVRRIAEICTVPGIDVLFIGPNDLASSLGVPGGYDNRHPDHVAAVGQVLDTARRFNIPAGIHCGSADEVNRRIEQGFQWMPIVSDTRFLSGAAQSAADQVKLPSRT
jgi:4-hydroxy-2-oxoheptanedioate aldolase